MDERILLGKFRAEEPPRFPGAAVVLCSCGQTLWTIDGVNHHWQLGHFDSNVYATKEEVLDKVAEKIAQSWLANNT
jgi:hypothetical protein